MTLGTRIALGISAAALSLGLVFTPAAFAQASKDGMMKKEDGMKKDSMKKKKKKSSSMSGEMKK
jgi:pentapeptide MXKDX repeat protein